jgi:hypothetical protein
MKKLISIALAVVVALAATYGAVQWYLWWESQPKEMVALGIIRPDGQGGWYVLDDGDHGPRNLGRLLVHPTHIEVFFTQPFGKLETFSTSVDDDLTLAGINAGASTGLHKIGIVLAGANGQIEPASVKNTLANIQISVIGWSQRPADQDVISP